MINICILFNGFYIFQKSFQYRAKVQDHRKNKTQTGTEPISEKKKLFRIEGGTGIVTNFLMSITSDSV